MCAFRLAAASQRPKLAEKMLHRLTIGQQRVAEKEWVEEPERNNCNQGPAHTWVGTEDLRSHPLS